MPNQVALWTWLEQLGHVGANVGNECCGQKEASTCVPAMKQCVRVHLARAGLKKLEQFKDVRSLPPGNDPKHREHFVVVPVSGIKVAGQEL